MNSVKNAQQVLTNVKLKKNKKSPGLAGSEICNFKAFRFGHELLNFLFLCSNLQIGLR